MSESTNRTDEQLISQLVSSPLGAVFLARREVPHRRAGGHHHFDLPPETDADAVSAAADELRAATWAQVQEWIVETADHWANPWSSSTPDTFVTALRRAPELIGIAEALIDGFGAQLTRPLDAGSQEYWNDALPTEEVWHRPQTYCCGEFHWAGAWTSTTPPIEAHEIFFDSWEMYVAGLRRWRAIPRPSARIREVNGPADWVELVGDFPLDVTGQHSSWELPGINNHVADIPTLAGASSGRVARAADTVVMPDWMRLRDDYDAIHLTWWGFLTVDGHVLDVPAMGPEAVTFFRYWGSERTRWLNDVFDRFEPLPPPSIPTDRFAP